MPRGFRDANAIEGEGRSNIVCISGASEQQTERTAELLISERIFISRREGTIRMSPHLFNSDEEIDRVLELIECSGSGSGESTAVPSDFELPVGPRLSTAVEAEAPRAVELIGRWVTLRPVDAERDAGDLYAASHGDVERRAVWTYMADGPFDSEAEMAELLKRRSRSSDPLFFTVAENGSGTGVGAAALMRIDPRNGCIEVGHIWYDPRWQRTRVNTETVYLLLKESFEQLGYRRVEWKCDALNRRSRSAALRLGFRFEGIFRQHMVIKGRNRDTAWFAMLDGDWSAVKQDFERWLESPEELSLSRLTQTRQAATRGQSI